MKGVLREEFENKAKRIAKEILKRDDFAIVHHYDADGISAGAIIAKALEKVGKKFKCKAVKQLYKETIAEIKGLGKNYVFVDFGSALVGELKKSFGDGFFVLDHHQPKDEDFEFHLNPIHYGISGGNEISGAGVSYFVAKNMGNNKELSALAIIGALGDMQDFSGALSGVNRDILEEGIEAGVLKVENDLRLYGRISRPLAQFLCFSSNPILPGLTANETACVEFLKANGIDTKRNEKWLSYDDLSFEEKKKLTTALLLHLQKHNVSEWKLQELIGEIYILKRENMKSPLRDGKEFATLLNSCGRHGKAELGLKVCMGDRNEYYGNALSLLAEHRKQLREGIELMYERGVDEREMFYFFDAGSEIKDSLVGIVAGMLYGSGAIEPIKPIIAFGRYGDGSIKVSARASSELVRRGLNLGKVLKEVENELGGIAQAGGHEIAAGMKISEEQKEKFLELLNEKISLQYAKG